MYYLMYCLKKKTKVTRIDYIVDDLTPIEMSSQFFTPSRGACSLICTPIKLATLEALGPTTVLACSGTGTKIFCPPF